MARRGGKTLKFNGVLAIIYYWMFHSTMVFMGPKDVKLTFKFIE